MANFINEYVHADGTRYPFAVNDHKNLLDNGWFTVNQRNFTSGAITNYFFDRWRGAREILSSTSNGITITWDGTNSSSGLPFGWIHQLIENTNVLGKTVTFSAILDGEVKYCTLTFPTTSTESRYELQSGVTAVFRKEGDLPLIQLEFSNNNAVNIRAVKLEYGIASTLALDHEPDYATELLKCQRYFWRVYGSVASGYLDTATQARFACKLPTEMRILPTMTTSYSSGVLIVSANGNKFSQSYSIVSRGKYDVLYIFVTTSGLTAGQGCLLVPQEGQYIDFNADL